MALCASVNPTPVVQQLFDVVRAGHMFEIVNTRPTDHPLVRQPPRLLTVQSEPSDGSK